MVSKDKCLDLSVIPQFTGTCWFNAILMIALYSENVRKVLIKTSKHWDKSNSFLMILKRILFTYYKQPDNVQKFFNKIKPETILLKMLKTFNDTEMIEYFKKTLKYKESLGGFIADYIIRFLKYIDINVLDVFYTHKKGFYLNIDNEIKYVKNDGKGFYYELKNYAIYNKNYYKDKSLINNIKSLFVDDKNEAFIKNKKKEIFKQTSKILENVPDIIILKHEDLLTGNINEVFKNLHHFAAKNIDEFNSSRYKFDVKGLDTYQDIIYLNGHKYKLDAVALSNYNKDRSGHAIAGITCNGNRYVYNGWNAATNDPGIKDKGTGSVSPCSLMRYDWDLRKDEHFCLNKKTCKLDFFDPKIIQEKLCFSFAKGRRLLVYVRVNDYNISSENNASHTPELSGMSEIIKELYNIDNLTEVQLRKALKENFKQYWNIYLDDYNDVTLRNLYYDAIIEKYKLNANNLIEKPKPTPKPTPKPKPKPKQLLKKDILKAVIAKYPDMKNLNSKTKDELLAILNGNKVEKKKKVILKKDLIEMVKLKKPNLKGLAKLTKAQLEALL